MKNIIIYFVLKEPSNVYNIEYIRRLQAGIQKNTPDNIEVNFVCLSNNQDTTTPLKYNWPGWWSKMELFRPDIKGDILYFDLDTVICNNLQDIYDMCFNNPFPIMIAPFHTQIGSGVMWLPENYRGMIWNKWIENPEYWMQKYKGRGDQVFITNIYRPILLEFQKIKPKCIASYKIHCQGSVPDGAKIICYHGKPRPHETNWAHHS
tara:strand:- start:719 stop:1336 length:618 start_codon:yes stop_codon:yes gene_type:complete